VEQFITAQARDMCICTTKNYKSVCEQVSSQKVDVMKVKWRLIQRSQHALYHIKGKQVKVKWYSTMLNRTGENLDDYVIIKLHW